LTKRPIIANPSSSNLHLKESTQPPTTPTTMETLTFPHFPPYATPIHIALFKDVTNSSGIRKRLIEASIMEGVEGDEARDKVDFGFVDASLVCPFRLLFFRLKLIIEDSVETTFDQCIV
jgi:hypothetical protein